MDIKQILELLDAEQLPGNDATSDFLSDAVASFPSRSASAATTIRRLQTGDPSGFAVAAVRLLASAEQRSPGAEYIASLVTAGNLWIEPLLDERVLSLEAAVPLAAKLVAVERCLDVQLVDKLVANAGGDVSAIPSATALRVLELVDAISDCSRLASHLVRFLRHPNAKVHSKAALLLGRANKNLTRVKNLLVSDDMRVRANAVESLWGHPGQDVRKMLWEATEDKSGRVVVNALLGLCQTGDRDAYLRLETLAQAADPALRSGAAWAMGETGDPDFGEALEKLEQDGDAKVRAVAEKSRQKLHGPEAATEVLST
ncbi:MAG: HEAT repeat domain-containing protein [Bryobacteraceae bacterium]